MSWNPAFITTKDLDFHDGTLGANTMMCVPGGTPCELLYWVAEHGATIGAVVAFDELGEGHKVFPGEIKEVEAWGSPCVLE